MLRDLFMSYWSGAGSVDVSVGLPLSVRYVGSSESAALLLRPLREGSGA
jgi:hypothetical protein